MELKIGENYRITTDSLNFILEKQVEVKPKDKPARMEWKQIGYYGNVAHIIDRVLNEELKANDITTVTDIGRKLSEFRIWFIENLTHKELNLLKRVNELESEVERLEKEVDKLEGGK